MHCFKDDYLLGEKSKKISHSDNLPPKYLLACYLHAYVVLKTTCFRKALNRIVFFYIKFPSLIFLLGISHFFRTFANKKKSREL